MRKDMKKVISGIAAAMLLTMTGCGSDSKQDASAKQAAAAPEAVTTTAAETSSEKTEAESEKTTDKKTEDTSSKKDAKKSKKKKKAAEETSSKEETKDGYADAERKQADAPEQTAPAEQTAPETTDTNDSGKGEAEKYMNDMRAAFKAYSTPLTGTYITALESGDYENARKALKEAAAGLEAIESIVPPEKYAELHAELADTLATERESLDFMIRYTEFAEKYNALKDKASPTEEERKEVQTMIAEMTALEEKMNSLPKDFATVFLKVMKTVKADIGG